MSAELPESKDPDLENRMLPMCPCCGMSLNPARVDRQVVWVCNGHDVFHDDWFRKFVKK